MSAGTFSNLLLADLGEFDSLLSRPTSKDGILQRAVLEVLRGHEERDEIPTNVRFLFYELEQLGSVRKKKASEGGRRGDQELQDAVLLLRDRGVIPWDWIIDETRTLHDWSFADTVAEGIIEHVGYQRINLWRSVRRPLILCEARSTEGVIRQAVGYEYLCATAATNGQARGFLETKIARAILEGDLRILYVGDYDSQGHQIEANTRGVLERNLGITFDEDRWERVALTSEQVSSLRARGVEPIRKEDRRYLTGDPRRWQEAFECEALGQGAVMTLLRARLDALLPEPLGQVRERERRQRQKVRRALAGLRVSS